MKKILLIIIIFICFKGFGQTGKYPGIQTLGSDSTLVESKGAFKSRLINRPFTDTTQANTQRIKWYEGAQLWTTTDKRFWIRDSLNNLWLSPLGGGSSDTANLLVKRWGSGKSIFGVDDDTLLLKDAANGVFTIARSTSDSSFVFDFDSASAAAKAWVEYYSAGGVGSGFTPGAVIIAGTDGAVSQDPTLLFWDDTNNRLAIGHNNPSSRLDIQTLDVITARFTNISGSGSGAGGGVSVISFDGTGPMEAGERLGVYAAHGGVSTSAISVAGGGALTFFAGGTWSPTSLPTYAQMELAPSGTTARSAYMTWLYNGNVGIGTSNQVPTARLQLPASTTGVGTGQLKFNSGPPPTTPEIGLMNMENGLWFIDSSNSIRDTVATREWARSNIQGAGGGSGETNTASNLGGGLANYSTKVGVDLQFNSFLASHFNLVSNQIEVDTANLFPIIRSTIPAGGGSGDVVLNDTLLTSGTSFTTPADITTSTVFKITIVGGGGGGSGSNGTNLKSAAGGAGGALIKYVSGLSPSTAYTYAIGAAGAGGVSAASGTNGGNTTLTIGATTYTGNGGTGGPTGSGAEGGAGGTATNGDINISGQNGDGSGTTGSTSVAGSRGGSPAFGLGMGGASKGLSGNGLAATGYGGGGGGGIHTTATGGAGTQGAIIIEWITGGGGGGGGTYTAGYGLTLPASAFILDTTIAVNKAGAQVISGAKNFTSASNKFSGLATDNTATKFVVAATDGTLGTQTIQTLSAYTSVDSLMSGQYTPTLANVTNVAGTTAVLCTYIKVGNKVEVSGQASCTVTASGGTFTNMSMTLPFASNFTLVTDCAGSASGETSAALLPAIVVTNTSTDVAELKFYSGSGAHTIYFSFIYFVK